MVQVVDVVQVGVILLSENSEILIRRSKANYFNQGNTGGVPIQIPALENLDFACYHCRHLPLGDIASVEEEVRRKLSGEDAVNS